MPVLEDFSRIFLPFRTELAKLPGDAKVFAAIDSDPALTKFMDGHTPVETKIGLKVLTADE